MGGHVGGLLANVFTCMQRMFAVCVGVKFE